MKTALSAAALTLALATPALAEITVSDAYARAASPVARSGAAFLVLENTGPEADRLVGVASPAAARVELHSHSEDANGMMVMGPIEGGIALEPGASHRLARGGDHVMFMGLAESWETGDTIPVTLTFETAGEVEVEIPVDNERTPDEGAHGGHGDHSDHGEHAGHDGHQCAHGDHAGHDHSDHDHGSHDHEAAHGTE